jgi:hypothetical protein
MGSSEFSASGITSQFESLRFRVNAKEVTGGAFEVVALSIDLKILNRSRSFPLGEQAFRHVGHDLLRVT